MLQIQYDSIIFKEGNTYVSYCPELDVSSCGNNIDEARKNLKIAVDLFIEEAKNMGTLEDILDEAGYELNDSNYWEAPRIVATELMSATF
jgi:predicted RNase H-like HicB family nuclease